MAHFHLCVRICSIAVALFRPAKLRAHPWLLFTCGSLPPARRKSQASRRQILSGGYKGLLQQLFVAVTTFFLFPPTFAISLVQSEVALTDKVLWNQSSVSPGGVFSYFIFLHIVHNANRCSHAICEFVNFNVIKRSTNVQLQLVDLVFNV